MPTDGRNKHIRRGNAPTNRWDDDPYTRRARQEHYPAWSVYKLQEIQKRSRVIRRRDPGRSSSAPGDPNAPQK